MPAFWSAIQRIRYSGKLCRFPKRCKPYCAHVNACTSHPFSTLPRMALDANLDTRKYSSKAMVAAARDYNGRTALLEVSKCVWDFNPRAGTGVSSTRCYCSNACPVPVHITAYKRGCHQALAGYVGISAIVLLCRNTRSVTCVQCTRITPLSRP